MISLTNLTKEVGQWARKNFGTRPAHQQVLGICEEAGELAHAQLKLEQGIRGTDKEHIAEMKDALGDIIIYMADLCYIRGFDFEEIVFTTWDKVSKRDWTKDKKKGGEDEKITCR